QAAIGGHAAANGEALESGLAQCLTRFLDQHINDRLLETGRKISALFHRQRRCWARHILATNGVKHRRLQAAKTEIEAIFSQKRAGKAMSLGIASSRFALNGRAAGKTQAQNAGDFVKSLASGIVQSGAQKIEIQGGLTVK